MIEWERKQSVVLYNPDPETGVERTINTLGKIQAVPPAWERKLQTDVRLQYAEKVVPALIEAIRAEGVPITSIKLTGSVAAGLAGKESDIDLEVELPGASRSMNDESYWIHNRALVFAEVQSLRKLGLKNREVYTIDIHLASDVIDAEYARYVKELISEGKAVGEKHC